MVIYSHMNARLQQKTLQTLVKRWRYPCRFDFGWWRMVKYVIRGVAVVGACVLSFLLWTAFHIPDFRDVDIANALADKVIASYGQFHPRTEVDKTSQGKVLYAHPGSGGKPTFVIYEVTDASERARIVSATRQALGQAHAASATLKFYERQNVTHFDGGGMRRGPEQLIEAVTVKPD